jgi:hypothetical protein
MRLVSELTRFLAGGGRMSGHTWHNLTDGHARPLGLGLGQCTSRPVLSSTHREMATGGGESGGGSSGGSFTGEFDGVGRESDGGGRG